MLVMSSNPRPDVTDADIDRAIEDEERLCRWERCRWEKMSGICMICGAGPDEECEWKGERR
jgi:hypothetical protein